MMMPDVNVLIYARRKDAPQHAASKAFLESIASGPSNFALSRHALSAVIRIMTNRKSFAEPEEPQDAFAYCRWLMDLPNAVSVDPGDRHWEIFEHLCVKGAVRGPLVADAWYAALAIEHDCEWVTFDRDFRRFEGLRWRTPA